MKINYMRFMKHATKMVKESKNIVESRPVLGGVHHTEDGTLYVTNNYYAYKAVNVNAPKDVTIHAETGEEMDQKYPDMSKIFPDLLYAEQLLWIHDVQDLIEMIQAMQYAYKKGVKRRTARIEFKENKLSLFERPKDITFEYLIADDSVKLTNMVFTSHYLLNSLEMIKDLGFNEVMFNFFGVNRPVVITPKSTQSLQALVLPWRQPRA